MNVIYYLKNGGPNGYIEGVNKEIHTNYPEYEFKFGLIGSKKWMDLYECGKISKDIKAGQITYIGQDRYEPEYEPNIIEIETDRRIISYPYEDFWLSPEIKTNHWVSIESIKVKIGDVTSIIDIKVTVIE